MGAVWAIQLPLAQRIEMPSEAEGSPGKHREARRAPEKRREAKGGLGKPKYVQWKPKEAISQLRVKAAQAGSGRAGEA